MNFVPQDPSERPLVPSWDTKALPEGQEKVRAVQEMFDAIALLRPSEPDHDLSS